MLHRLGYIEKNPQDMLLKLSENLRQIPPSFWKKKNNLRPQWIGQNWTKWIKAVREENVLTATEYYLNI